MAVQTSYTGAHPVAFAGMIHNMEPATLISRVLESATMNFGAAVFQGANNALNCRNWASGAVFRGVAVARDTVPAGNNDVYVQTDTVEVMTKGVIWVTAGAAVTAAGAPAYFDGAGVITPTSTSNTLIANAIFDSAAASGALVKLRLQ